MKLKLPSPRALKITFWIVAVWISVSLVSYGLALRGRSTQGFSQLHVDQVGPTDGKVKSVRRLGSRVFGYHFQMDAFPFDFHIPAQFIRSEEAWTALDESLLPGSSVWFKAIPGENVVIQMTVNFRTPVAREVVHFDDVQRLRPMLPTFLSQTGTRFMVVGFLVLPLAAALWFGLRYAKRMTVSAKTS